MYETVILKCRCGNNCVHAAPTVDIAEMLRCAIGDGWRKIDEEPVKAVESAGMTEIELYGQCRNCTLVEEDYRRFHATPEPRPRLFKTLHDIIARRGAR
jgi:hypothetical protein